MDDKLVDNDVAKVLRVLHSSNHANVCSSLEAQLNSGVKRKRYAHILYVCSVASYVSRNASPRQISQRAKRAASSFVNDGSLSPTVVPVHSIASAGQNDPATHRTDTRIALCNSMYFEAEGAVSASLSGSTFVDTARRRGTSLGRTILLLSVHRKNCSRIIAL